MDRRRCILWSLAFLLLNGIVVYFLLFEHLRSPYRQTRQLEMYPEVFFRPSGLLILQTPQRACVQSGHFGYQSDANEAIKNESGFTNENIGMMQNRSEKGSVFLLIGVCSSAKHLDVRAAIRETWGNLTNQQLSIANKNGKVESMTETYNEGFSSDTRNSGSLGVPLVQNLFVILPDPNISASLQSALKREIRNHGDVIYGTYLNRMSRRVQLAMMLLHWVSSTCQNVKYVMKTDDDVFVNVPRLVSHLQRHGRKNLLLGSLNCDPFPNESHLDPAISHHLYGWSYVMSGELIPRLYRASQEVPLFDQEDVFVTGICAKRIGARPVNHKGFIHKRIPHNTCVYRNVITSHNLTLADLRFIWLDLQTTNRKCETFYMNLDYDKNIDCYG